MAFPDTNIPIVFEEQIILVQIFILITISLLIQRLLLEVPQVIESKHITITHSRDMLQLTIKILAILLPYIIWLPLLVLVHHLFLPCAHVHIHLVLQHDVDLLFELIDARVILGLRLLALPNILHAQLLRFLKDQIACILSD